MGAPGDPTFPFNLEPLAAALSLPLRGFACLAAFAVWGALLSGCSQRGDTVPVIVFEDGSAEAGLGVASVCGTAEKSSILESGGCGAALADVDNDGDVDIYLVNAAPSLEDLESGPGNRLLLNDGHGIFSDRSRGSGADLRLWGTGCCAGDYDNDGWIDIYLTAFGNNRLLRNLGQGRFEEVSAEAGVSDHGFSTGCAFFDADLDGDLDLYVVHYVETTLEEQRAAVRDQPWRAVAMVMRDPAFAGYHGEPDSFFRNRGDGTFQNASGTSGLAGPGARLGRGVAATDLDLDGLVDLYVTNDLEPNSLFKNLGDGTFEESGLESGAALSGDGMAQAAKGVDLGDVDLDGLPEVFVTNFATEPNALYKNHGAMRFSDVTASSGLQQAGSWPMGWGALFEDFDRDTDLDLFVANGHDYPQVDRHPELKETYRQANHFFVNEGRLFSILPYPAVRGPRRLESSRGACSADVDGDGDVDLLVTNMDAAPSLLLNRTDTGNNWLQIRLEGTRSNRSALGARVVVTAEGRRMSREVRSGRGFASHSDLTCSFGLAKAAFASSVEVRWPSGRESRLTRVKANRLLLLREP